VCSGYLRILPADLVGNNLPFSSSRDADKASDDEFVLPEVGDFLKAK
jgi:hypothetical protein